MKLPDNVERSAFRPGYVGWDGLGGLWHITRTGNRWVARPAPNHRGRDTLLPVTCKTLTEAGATLASRTHKPPVEPF